MDVTVWGGPDDGMVCRVDEGATELVLALRGEPEFISWDTPPCEIGPAIETERRVIRQMSNGKLVAVLPSQRC